MKLRHGLLALLVLAGCTNNSSQDGGSESSAPDHADVQPDTLFFEEEHDVREIADVIVDDVLDVLDSSHDANDDVAREDSQDVPTDRPGQDAGDGGSVCSCPAPAQDSTTFSLAFASFNGSNVTTLRDYSTASATAQHVLANNTPTIVWTTSVSFNDNTGKLYQVQCTLYTSIAGARQSNTQNSCRLTVTGWPNNPVLANAMTAVQTEVQSLTDTSADFVIPPIAASGAGGNFTVSNISMRIVRPNGGLITPPRAMLP